jgi:transposase-like protein
MMQPESAAHVNCLTDGNPRCPSCEKRTGRLFSVALKGSVKTLTYRCVDCNQQWLVIDFSPGATDPSFRAQRSTSEDDERV